MPKHTDNISELFYAGLHSSVIEKTLDLPHAGYSPSDFPFVIGALSYLGRMDEAERLYKMKRGMLGLEDLLKCRYFLGVGMCRHSYYANARRYFFENFAVRRKATDGESQFFIYQGLGFYQYFAGRMKNAKQNAERGLNASLSAGFLYGRAMSMDLKGHSTIQIGEVGPGLETLRIAEQLATQLGAAWLSEAILVSIVSYRARFGIAPETALAEITQKLASLSKQDIYSQSTLLLDLAQLYIRRGDISQARKALNDCCRLVYGLGNRRHAALLNLRYAYIHYLEGEPHLALNLLRNALTQIEPKIDVLLELKLRGLEERLVLEMGLEICTEAQLQVIQKLTKRVREITAHRILLRKRKVSLSTNHVGEDPFGDLFDLVHREPKHAVEAIIESGYFGLLNEVLGDSRGKRILYLDLEPGSLTLFDKGTVEHCHGGLSRSARSILLELQHGKRTKEELIRTIWKYEYHPLRHDALIYSAIAKLRKLLGKRSHWLEVSENGYSLRQEVQVLAYAETNAVPAQLQVKEEQAAGAETPLNPRQQKILRFLEQNEFIDSMTCKGMFKTSEITASRDLSELVKLQLVLRVGKGRATKYSRGMENQ